MTDTTPALINGDDVLASGVSEVHSPYDGALVGQVPACTTDDLDRAVAVALQRHRAGAMPAHQRAEILDRAAAALAERIDEFAASPSPPSRPSRSPPQRVEAQRAVDTIRFSAAVARTFTGEMVPLDASSAGVGKLGFTKRVPIGVVGCDLARSTSRSTWSATRSPRRSPPGARWCSSRPRPRRSPRSRIARLFEECGLPPGWLNVVTCGGSVANHLVEHPDVAMITFTGSPRGRLGHPGPGRPQAGQPGARQQRPGDHRAGRRLGRGGGQDRRRRLLVRRPVLHLGAAGLRAPLAARGVRGRAGGAGRRTQGR